MGVTHELDFHLLLVTFSLNPSRVPDSGLVITDPPTAQYLSTIPSEAKRKRENLK
jgi:hypothetical protein